MIADFRTPGGGRIDRNRPLAFTFDGQPPLRLRRRHARLGPPRQRRPSRRALVQISPPARHSRARLGRAQRARRSRRRGEPLHAEPARDAGRALRRARGRQPEQLALARLRPAGRQWPLLRPDPGRLLLQDLHASAWRLGAPLRAADPPRRRPRPRAARARRRPLRQSLRPLRRRRRRRRPGRARRGARGRARSGRRASSSSTSRPSSAARCSPRPARPSTARRPPNGWRRASPSSRRRRMSRSCRARRSSAITTRTSSPRSSASTITSLRPIRACRASGCGRCAPSACRAGDRRA